MKYNSNGTIQCYKARLVIRGGRQFEVFEYNETFAPVAEMTSVVLLAIGIAKDWALHQLDVNNTFLHGDLEEQLYMKMPPEFISSDNTKVCKLQKYLYGLRQAPHQWFTKLCLKLYEYSFVRFYADYPLFIYRQGTTFRALLVTLMIF